MKFKNPKHENRYYEILEQMKSEDGYHRAVAYLFALDTNFDDAAVNFCFDFKEDAIKPQAKEGHGWMTGFDRRIIMLAFHLWNDSNPINLDLVFGSENEYLLEAIRLRYTWDSELKKESTEYGEEKQRYVLASFDGGITMKKVKADENGIPILEDEDEWEY